MHVGIPKSSELSRVYDELAFEPARDVPVSEMLSSARSALNSTYTGYKGGEYKMDEWTDCWLAHYGCTGETIGPYLLGFMIGDLPGSDPS